MSEQIQREVIVAQLALRVAQLDAAEILVSMFYGQQSDSVDLGNLIDGQQSLIEALGKVDACLERIASLAGAD